MNAGGLTAQAKARLLVSLVIEPGDPRGLAVRETPGGPAAWWDRLQRRGDLPAAWLAAVESAEDRAAAALRRAGAIGARWVVPGHPQWPAALDDLEHPEGIGQVAGAPWGLWVRGGGDLAEAAGSAVAVVGARSCTTYGSEVASDIAADCADQGLTVVSGAAFGIDASAHRGALLACGRTVAVLACGVDLDYPSAHAALLRRIGEEGLIVSEYPPGEGVQRHRFLVRNRVIAALGLGTVVVEAAIRSGSLNTLHWADQLGRTTLAVPGPVTSQLSSGTHRAVRDGKAVLVTSGTEVMTELLGLEPEGDLRVGPAARRVWNRLDATPRTVPDLAAGLRLGTTAVGRALAELERLGVAGTEAAGWSRVRAGIRQVPAGTVEE